MATYVLTLFLIAYLILIFVALRLRRHGSTAAFSFFLIPTVGYVIGYVIMLVSSQLESNSFLTVLSSFGYYLQLVTTPFFIMMAFELLRYAGQRWARTSWLQAIIWTLTFLLIGFGLYLQYTSSTITEQQFTAPNGAGLPFEDAEPITTMVVSPPSTTPALLVALGVVALGVLIYRQLRWPWMLYGAVCMVILHALPAEQVGPTYAALGKLIMSGLLLLTAFRLYVLDPTLSTSANAQRAITT